MANHTDSRILQPSLTAFQAQFRRRYDGLRDVHVRSLAWLLEAPDLLDAHAPQWHAAVAVIDGVAGEFYSRREVWLAALDAAPAPLHAAIDAQPTARLGRYAEKLLAFYLQASGCLYAANLQVHANANLTVGEFDFLLYTDNAGCSGAVNLIHWEFATKFYLLAPRAVAQDGMGDAENAPGGYADHFVGPNLADTLGAKMAKIIDRQLRLSAHPAAQAYLPPPLKVSLAAALVKGWLFYRDPWAPLPAGLGVAPGHCKGYWCTRAELEADPAFHHHAYAILPRLQWLAPARVTGDAVLQPDAALAAIAAAHAGDPAPLMLAVMQSSSSGADAAPGSVAWHEISRGFIVPDDWQSEAQRYGARQAPVRIGSWTV